MRRPMRRLASLDAYWLVICALAVAIGLMLAVVVVQIAIPELERAGVLASTATVPSTPDPDATPDPSAEIDMGGAAIPANAECAGCHKTDQGGIGLRPIPVMGHPLESWGKCTDCHAPARLVDTAPGHRGIHATECTTCHKPGDLPAPLSRPHRENQNLACLSCHGTATAPLPADMSHRKEASCWLCHRLPTVEPPVPAHATAPGEADCRTCHKAGGRAGTLPADHLDRDSGLCLSCHEVVLGVPPTSTPGLTTWPAPSNTTTSFVAPLVPLSR
jgi:hypothetical protein